MRGVLILISATAASCGDDSGVDAGSKVDAPQQAGVTGAAPGFRRTACAGAAGAPPPGAVFTSTLHKADGSPPSRTTSTIESSRGGMTVATDALYVNGAPVPVTVRSAQHDGFVSAGWAGRTIIFERSPDAALQAMAPGESIRLPALERFHSATGEGEWRTTHRVTLLNCGTLSFRGATEPVKVYLYTGEFGALDGKGAPGAGTYELSTTYYVSQRYGWPLRAEHQKGGVRVLDSVSGA